MSIGGFEGTGEGEGGIASCETLADNTFSATYDHALRRAHERITLADVMKAQEQLEQAAMTDAEVERYLTRRANRAMLRMFLYGDAAVEVERPPDSVADTKAG